MNRNQNPKRKLHFYTLFHKGYPVLSFVETMCVVGSYARPVSSSCPQHVPLLREVCLLDSPDAAYISSTQCPSHARVAAVCSELVIYIINNPKFKAAQCHAVVADKNTREQTQKLIALDGDLGHHSKELPDLLCQYK